jgi:hypothetical protein
MRFVLSALLVLSCAPVWGAKNLVTTSTGTAQVGITSLAVTSATPLTLQVAFDHFEVTASSVSFVGAYIATNNPWFTLRRSGTTLQVVDNFDSGFSVQPGVDISGWQVTGGSDFGFSAVVQRDPAAGKVSLQVCHMDGTSCTTSTATVTGFGSGTLVGMFYGRTGNGAGNNGVYGDLALLRLSNTLYGATVPPNAHNAPSGNNADWEFGTTVGSLVDSVGPYTLVDDWGAVSYSNTTLHNPVCNAGTTQTFRAGQSASLDSSGSYALDGNTTLNTTWQQSAGPSTAYWSSHTAASPSVSALVFGQYTFGLTVTDGSGQPATCTVDHGVVATDANGNLLISNPNHRKYFNANPYSNDPVGVPALLSNATAGVGVNAYPYYVTSNKVMADVVINASTLFAQEWNVAATGTISVAGTCADTLGSPTGCDTVTGVGTHFNTDFCTAGVKKAGVHLVIWYNSSLYPGSTGRRQMEVSSCASDTSLTLTQQFYTFGVVDHSTAGKTQNLNYSVMTDAVSGSYWGQGRATAGYYDNMTALLYMYYATGLTKYLTAFRTITDALWTFPTIDRGSLYYVGNNAGSWIYAEPRNLPNISFIMRAMDLDFVNGTTSDMWAGIRSISLWSGNAYFKSGYVEDLRNASFSMEWYSLLSIFDPDATQRGTDCTGGKACWYQKVKDANTNSWAPSAVVSGNQNYWIANDAAFGGSPSFSGGLYTGTVTVTNNSTTVTGSGTNFLTSWYYNGTVHSDATQIYTNGCMGKITVSSITNANPAVFTLPSGQVWPVGETIGIQVAGGTGNWAAVNGYWVATALTSTTFALKNFNGIGIDSSGFGAMTGTITVDKGGWIWFLPAGTTSMLTSGRALAGEATAYRIDVANSNTQLTLLHPYTGTTGTRTYACVGNNMDSNATNGQATLQGDGLLAGSVQPFMLGIAGQGFLWAREAALANADSTLASTFAGYVTGIGYAMKDRAYTSTFGGNTYWMVSPTADIAVETERCYACMSQGGYGDVDGMKINLVEGFHGLTMLYRFAPSAPLATEIDSRMGKVWGKPGTGGLTSDATYLTDPESFWTPLGDASVVAGRLSWKWFGYMAGTGQNWAWLSSRVGGLASAQTRTMKVSARIADHPSATELLVVVTDPQGNITESTVCASSPCAITTPDARQGDHLYQVKWRNSSHAVVMSGDVQPLRVQ